MAIRHDTTAPRSSLWNNNHVGNLDDLDDVTITSPATGATIVWNGAAWVDGDHGDLAGLADDDHTQYIKDTEYTATGAILKGTGAGTFDALTIGSSGDVLTVAAGTASWAAPASTALTAAAVQAVGHYELLMAAGISSPPEPLDDGTGTDWLYVWVTP